MRRALLVIVLAHLHAATPDGTNNAAPGTSVHASARSGGASRGPSVWGCAPWRPTNESNVLMMITRARSGSSYTSSLLSESPDALGFFELFNKFAHMNIFNQSLTKDVRLPFLEALVPDATERLALLARNNDTVLSALLDAVDGAPSERVADVARHLAASHGKAWCAYKDFSAERAARVCAAPEMRGRVVLLLLRRNYWQRLASFDKIEVAHCSRYLRSTNSTECKVPISGLGTAEFDELLALEMYELELLRRAEAGLWPFAASLPVATFDYDEAAGLPLQEVARLLASRVNAAIALSGEVFGNATAAPAGAAPGGLCWRRYRLRGLTARHYGVQDRAGSFAEKITNYNETRAFWTAERRLALCRRMVETNLRPDDPQIAAALGHCARTRHLDLPPLVASPSPPRATTAHASAGSEPQRSAGPPSQPAQRRPPSQSSQPRPPSHQQHQQHQHQQPRPPSHPQPRPQPVPQHQHQQQPPLPPWQPHHHQQQHQRDAV